MLGSTPERIERQLTLGILRGDYPAGSRLPTVRKLAARYRVNQATIQRVVARLETRGLIYARQGSGLSVNDPYQAGDLSLIPIWIDASFDDPPRAIKLLSGVLDVRRIMVSRLIVSHREQLLAWLPTAAADAAAVAQAAREGGDALRLADLAFVRKLLVSMDEPIALSIVNTVVKILDQVPLVGEAMYAEPQKNVAALTTVMTALKNGGPNTAQTIEEAMAKVDRETVARFEKLLATRNKKPARRR